MSRTKNPSSKTNVARAQERNVPEDIWQKNPEIIKSFLGVRPEYEQLCTEVEYILRKRISDINIETSSVGSRAKTLNSFLEKLKRKNYPDPFEQLTDLAGARVVCLYNNDIPKIVDVIREEFTILEEIDKLEELDSNKFGYIGKHFIVRLGRNSSGARYDDLKHLKCEIQVRTVVQDAWSIIQHHMAYKNESQVPTKLLRKLNSLAGLFETVDDQFELIRAQRDSYVDIIRESTSAPERFLQTEVNYDSFIEYLNWRFPGRAERINDEQVSIVLDALSNGGFSNLGELNDYLESNKEKTSLLISRQAADHPLYAENLSPAVEVAIAMSINPDWRESFPWSSDWFSVFNEILKP